MRIGKLVKNFPQIGDYGDEVVRELLGTSVEVIC